MYKDEEKKEAEPRESEDLTFEDEQDLDNPKIVIKKLREKLRDCEKERQEYLTGWQKAKADFINLRKQDEEHKRQFSRLANIELIQEILPILDSLEHALADQSVTENSHWRTGIESIQNQILFILKKKGIERFNPIGELFNPSFHEAINVGEVRSKEDDNKIILVHQAGYKFDNRVIRTAKVMVGEYRS